MKLFANGKKEKYTIIAGCGRLGANLADELSNTGENVLIIDRDKDSFRKLSPSFGGLMVTGDATDILTLTEAQIETAETVISVTNNDNTNILVAQIAKELFQVRRVIARLYDSERECVYREFAIDTICPSILSAQEVDKLLNFSRSQPQANQSGQGELSGEAV